MSDQMSLFPMGHDKRSSKRKPSIGLSSLKRREDARRWHKENKARDRAYYQQNKAKLKVRSSRPDVKLRVQLRRYGLTEEWYFDQLEKQEYKCSICGTDFRQLDSRRVHVDHDHYWGNVRDLLCQKCNHAVENVRECVTVAEGLVRYVKKWGQVFDMDQTSLIIVKDHVIPDELIPVE